VTARLPRRCSRSRADALPPGWARPGRPAPSAPATTSAGATRLPRHRRRGAPVPDAAALRLRRPPHRGIGDKHVPWIHNVRNTDLVAAVDDEATVRLLRLFNEPAATSCCSRAGFPRRPWRGCRCLASRASATSWRRSRRRATSSSTRRTSCSPASPTPPTSTVRAWPSSRPSGGVRRRHGARRPRAVPARHHHRSRPRAHLPERKALHNLKYFTWVEQQGRTVAELDRLWSATVLGRARGLAAGVGRRDRGLQRRERRAGAAAARGHGRGS